MYRFLPTFGVRTEACLLFSGKGPFVFKASAIVIALTFSTLILSGCATFVESDVAAVHQLGGTPIPKTYAFFLLDVPENGLGYKTYAALIRRQLEKYQYKEVVGDEHPDVVIALDCGIDTGKEKIISIPDFGQPSLSFKTIHSAYDRYKRYKTHFGNPIQKPNYEMVGSNTLSITEYDRSLRLYIVDANSMGTEKLNVVYEGRVKSSGSSSQLSKVIPAMIEALFRSFPGKSGETRKERVSIQ